LQDGIFQPIILSFFNSKMLFNPLAPRNASTVNGLLVGLSGTCSNNQLSKFFVVCFNPLLCLKRTGRYASSGLLSQLLNLRIHVRPGGSFVVPNCFSKDPGPCMSSGKGGGTQRSFLGFSPKIESILLLSSSKGILNGRGLDPLLIF